MSVVIVPGFLMPVSGAFGGEMFKGRFEIVVNQSWLEFGRRDPGRRTDDENRDKTLTDPSGIHELNDMICEV